MGGNDNWLTRLLKYAHGFKATDIHIGMGSEPLIRINGKLTRAHDFGLVTPEIVKEVIEQLIQNKDKYRTQLETSKEVDCSFSQPGLGRFRANIYSQRDTFAVAIRTLPFEIPSLEQLGLKALDPLIHINHGLILVTGATGSGKSTTLASLVNEINQTYDYHIVTIEDPIEYLHKHSRSFVTQREIGSDVIGFPQALRSSLREDPDVIMVGEMRDTETINIALTAAETGHLVLSTLHTIGAASTVNRIVDAFPSEQQTQIRTQLASVLEAVVSQQLIPKADGSGLIAASELMLSNVAISNLLREGKGSQINSAIQTGQDDGMYRMEHDLIRLYREGLITKEAMYKRALDETSLKLFLGKKV